uniref:Uncharacterized protein n=1 Tax=Cacopsylla melanoneura TaxID=428564 RepID=A0A8D8RTP5_9HEMI
MMFAQCGPYFTCMFVCSCMFVCLSVLFTHSKTTFLITMKWMRVVFRVYMVCCGVGVGFFMNPWWMWVVWCGYVWCIVVVGMLWVFVIYCSCGNVSDKVSCGCSCWVIKKMFKHLKSTPEILKDHENCHS